MSTTPVTIAKKLLEELRLTHYLLFQLKEDAKGDPHKWSETIRSLIITAGPIDQFNKTLKFIEEKLGAGSGQKKFGKALKWTFQKAEVQGLLSTLERQKAFFNLALQNDHRALTRAIKDDIQEVSRKIDDLQLGQKYQENRIRDQESRDIVDWLSSLNFWATQNDNFERHQKGTGEWMLNVPNFRKWVEYDGNVLWCPGDPGTGKTILTSIIINHLQKQYVQHDNVGIVFVCFNHKEPNSTTEILGSLLQQLQLRKTTISSAIYNLWETHTKRDTRPTLPELLTLLQDEAQNFTKLFVVLDALDECPEKYQDRDCRDKLLTVIHELGPGLQLLATGRSHIKNVTEVFPDATIIKIRGTEEDIRKYVNSRIDMERNLKYYIGKDTELRRRVTRKIAKKVDGMFLMAELHVGALGSKLNRKEILAALHTLPDKLNEIYDEVMNRIASQKEEELTPKQLQHAVAITSESKELGEDDLTHLDHLISLCCGIVTEDKESGTIRLVHFTTQEYFQRKGNHFFLQAHERIVTTCVKYITLASWGKIEPSGAGRYVELLDTEDHPSSEEDEVKEQLASEDKGFQEFSQDLWQGCPLLYYSSAFWGVHARETEVSESIQKCILTFLRDDDIRLFSLHALQFYSNNAIDYDTTYIPALSITAIFGLPQITQLLLSSGEVVSAGEKPYGYQALHYAAIYGHANVLLELLDNGAEVDALSFSLTPLHFAAAYGHSGVVETLLKNGAAVNAEDHYGRTATSLAEWRGHFDVKDILVKHGGTPKGTPRSPGLWGWHRLEVVKQLSARDPELK